jgi:hypothetical protein
MNRINRFLSAAVAAVLFICASCSAAGDTGGKSDLSQNANSDFVEEETTVGDDLPQKNFDGRKFRVGVRTPAEYEIFTELTGEVTDDAIFYRNARISERFNVEITAIPISDIPDTCYEQLVNSVRAGDDAYDLFGCYVYLLYMSASARVLRNWLEVEHINTFKPWWNSEINDNATINGILYGLTGTLAITYMQYAESMFYNVKAAEDHGITQDMLYDLVKSGSWTIDKLSEYVSGMYADLNGNGRRDIEDRYGIGASKPVSYDVWPAAFDIKLTGKDSDGYITVEYINERTVTALEKIIDLFHVNPGGIIYEGGGTYNDHTYFIDDKIVFFPTYLMNAFFELREMENPYSIIPLPKWDENQKKYRSLVIDGYTIWQIPKTVEDTEFVGIITEALAADTYYNVYPVFYDVAMKNKYSQDEKTAEMVDLVVENAVFDFSFMYGVYMEYLPYLFRFHVVERNPDIISDYKRKEKAINKKIQLVYELYLPEEPEN